jgi:hypothetical protein
MAMHPKLKFSCPEKWSAMSAQEGGRHCESCGIVVQDFSNLSNEEILREISQQGKENACGSFKAYQLQEPFSDRRNNVVRFYQRAVALPKKKYFTRSFQLGLAMILLLLSGCHKRLTGYCRVDPNPVRSSLKAGQHSAKTHDQKLKVRKNW